MNQRGQEEMAIRRGMGKKSPCRLKTNGKRAAGPVPNVWGRLAGENQKGRTVEETHKRKRGARGSAVGRTGQPSLTKHHVIHNLDEKRSKKKTERDMNYATLSPGGGAINRGRAELQTKVSKGGRDAAR